MTDDMPRTLVEEHWSALEAQPITATHHLRVSQLPVVTHQGHLAAAVDHDGHRHLLVPVPSHRKVRPGLDGPVLELRRRPLEDEGSYQMYADLACLTTDMNDLFTGLCVDVLGAAGRQLGNPLKALYQVLDHWKALFQTYRPPLGPVQLAGLFGELTVLERLLQLDAGAYRLWLGPKGHRHDFSTGRLALEVKTTSDESGRKVRIHGLDQLEPPVDGSLHLVWFRLHRTTSSSTGTSVVSLVERVLRLCDDEEALLSLLAEAGYRSLNADRYLDVRFTLTEEGWYFVGDGFPSLTTRALLDVGLPVSVHDVEYSIELAGAARAALPTEQVPGVLERFILGAS